MSSLSNKLQYYFLRLNLAQKAGCIVKTSGKLALGATVTLPLISVAQGTYFLATYRLSHGDAPHPASPSSGVVIVSPDNGRAGIGNGNGGYGDRSMISNSVRGGAIKSLHDSTKTREVMHKTWRHSIWSYFRRHDGHRFSLDDKKDRPLRLFVAGDSLAVGVGTSKSGTPILPEAIARHLSKELGGRPVYWTCIGTPGASTKRITGDIKAWLDLKLLRKSNDISDMQQSNEIAYQPHQLRYGRVNVHDFETTFSQDADNDTYDVVVVLTGLNDLKGIMLPFLTTESGKNDVGFKEELRNIFFLLKEKLKWRIQKLKIDKLDTKGTSDERMNENESVSCSDISKRDSKHLQSLLSRPAHKRPLMVLPALPTIPIPIFQYPPIGWFAHALFQCLDDEKRSLSKEHPDTILFVDAPSSELIQNIEKGTSGLCSNRKTERVILALKDIKFGAQQKIENLMKEHSLIYSAKVDEKECEAEKSCDEAFHLNLMKKMPAFLGSKLVSYDKIHPNDDGYDYWGRHIAAAIVDKWNGTQSLKRYYPS